MNNIDFDKRQLELMIEQIDSFEKNLIDLGALIGSLEFLLNAMESVQEKWEDKFLEELTILETINALNLTERKKEDALFKIESEKKIEQSIKILKLLIKDFSK